MTYAPLSDLHDWHLVHSDQDIRGWKVIDATGDTIGKVDELLVSMDSEMVEAVRLDNGAEYNTGDIEIGDGMVYVRGQRSDVVAERTEPVARSYRDARIRHRSGMAGGTTGTLQGPGTMGAGAATTGNTGTTIAGTAGTLGGVTGTEGPSTHHRTATSPTVPTGFNEMHNDFHGHYRSTLGETGRDYTFYEPAYSYGYTCAIDESYHGRDWTVLEPEIRQRYERDHGTGTWDRVKDAVRHAFQRGRGYHETRHE